jgi:hypothetical protein
MMPASSLYTTVPAAIALETVALRVTVFAPASQDATAYSVEPI